MNVGCVTFIFDQKYFYDKMDLLRFQVNSQAGGAMGTI